MAQFSPEVRRGGGLPFGQVVSQWMCDPRYSTNLRTLYGILVTYADVGARDTSRGHPYRKALAAQLGVSEKTVDRTLFEGECAGLWRIEERKSPERPEVNDANVYHLADAAFWRGEWVDPLAPGEKAADVAKALVAKRVAEKKAAGIMPKGGRKKKAEGVPSPVTPPPEDSPKGGPVTGDGTPGVMHDGTPGVTDDALSLEPSVENQAQEHGGDRRPSVPVGSDARSATDGRTDAGSDHRGEDDQPAAGGGVENQQRSESSDAPYGQDRWRPTTPGAEVLRRMGLRVPRLAVAGRVLEDQARRLNELVAASEHEAARTGGIAWTTDLLVEALAVPFDDELRKSAGAVVSARIKALPLTPDSAMLPAPRAHQPQRQEQEHAGSGAASAPRPRSTVDDEINRRPMAECSCGNPAAESGKCPECLGWPLCEGGCDRRLRDGGTCPTCALTAHHDAIRREPAPDGTCAGITGPCGRAVVSLGMCAVCRVIAETTPPKSCGCGDFTLPGADRCAGCTSSGGVAVPTDEELRDLLDAAAVRVAQEQSQADEPPF